MSMPSSLPTTSHTLPPVVSSWTIPRNGSCCMIYIDGSGTITFYDLLGMETDASWNTCCTSCSCQMFHHFYCDCSCNGRTCCDCSNGHGHGHHTMTDCSGPVSMDCSGPVSMDCSMTSMSISIPPPSIPYSKPHMPVEWSYNRSREDISGTRRLVLMDSRVRGYAFLLGCLLPTVDYVVVTYHRDTYADVRRWINLYHTNFDSVAYLSNGTNVSNEFYFSFLWKEESAVLQLVHQLDPSMNTWKPFFDIFKDVSGASYIDFLGSNLYSIPPWKYVLDGMEQEIGMTIRSSMDMTGNTDICGNWNWILEDGDIDVKSLYFNDNILQYPYQLSKGSM